MNYLFIGTFNPIWDVKNGDNPDYFYSRDKSQFWCILPHAFNKDCLVDKNRLEKEKFCRTNLIGLTDLIYELENVNMDNENDKLYLTKGFKDENFESTIASKYVLDIVFFTPRIMDYIRENQQSLKGVFFTRKTGTNIPRIWSQWAKIKNTCRELNIFSGELPSPSVRGGGIRTKIFTWRKAIESSKSKRV